MKLIQPYRPPHTRPVAPAERAVCGTPVIHVQSRHGHHAGHSGHDRLCDYVGETLRLPRSTYWFGETLLRPFALYLSKFTGHFEYSRYDATLELACLQHMATHRNHIYHFIYGEKNFHLARHLAGRRGHLLVGTLHHPRMHYDWLFRDPAILRKLDHAIVMATEQIPYTESIIGQGKVSFIPYGIDATYFTPPPEPRSGGATTRFLFAGSHLRDVPTLIACIERLLEVLPDATFDLLTGESACRELADRESRVTAHQGLEDEAYLSLLRACDALLLPLHASTACTTVLEAMACGMPVVTTRGGISDYLAPDYALECPLGDAGAMTDACVQLATDGPRRLAMGAAARTAVVQTFAWPHVARRHAALYEQLRTKAGASQATARTKP